MKTSKRVRHRNEGIDFQRAYGLEEAIHLIKERASAKFNETVEVVFACNIDPRKGEQNIRGMVKLPFGTGKDVRIAVFAEGEQASQAKLAGVHCVGGQDLIEEVLGGRMDFDLCIATPEMMGTLSKLGKILGPKGLMPNPKLGTVTHDVIKAIESAKQGQVSFRPDKEGIVHSILGKMNFSMEALSENFKALHTQLLSLKPAAVKNALIKKICISSSMGFSLNVDLTKVLS